jgi:hypothetical protein
MSEEKPNKNNLINFIAATVETMRDQMVEMRDQMVKKDDLVPFQDQIAYIGGQVETMRDQIVGMRDQMATKSDLAQLESRLTTKLEVEITAVRGDIEQVHLRLDSIERAFRARMEQIETELSRLRSVVYLLVKDRPDMLRLLGQTPPASEESRP